MRSSACPIYHSTYSTTPSANKGDILGDPLLKDEIHDVKFARRAYAVGEDSNDMAVSTEEALSSVVGPWGARVTLMDL